MTEHKWCAIDAEGDVGNKGLLGVAFYSDDTQFYYTDHRLIRGMLYAHADNGYTFLAHNAQYDLPVIFWQLDIPMKAVYMNGRFNRGEWKYDKRKPMCQLWDTLGLAGGIGLKRLGAALGIPKYNTPQRLLGIDPNRYTWFCDLHDEGECERCYAVRDAEIVYKFMSDFTATLAAWGVAPKRRLSSIALNTWKALDHPEPIGITDWKIEKLGRAAYHGGRCETYKLGYVTGIYAADVCSMYPSVMLETPYPDPAHMVYLKDPSLEAVPWDCEGVIEADVTVPSMYVPPLPYVSKKILHYPIGRFRGSWTIAELRYARTLGCVIGRVFQLAYSPTNLRPFTNYINTLWTMREEYERKNDPRSFHAKILLNSLYGRLGMKKGLERRDIFPADPNTRIEKQNKTGWYTDDGRLFLTYERDQKTRIGWENVVWAAQTTGAARIKLHAHLLAQGSGLVYSDTDSVFSRNPIIGLGEGLGQLRAETQYQALWVQAPKQYATLDLSGTWKGKAKGVRDEYALDYLREGHVTYSQPVKPRSQAIRGVPAGTWIDVTKEDHRQPARRPPVEPEALYSEFGMSDTRPAFVGPVPKTPIGGNK